MTEQDRQQLTALSDSAESVLRENILAFWIAHARDAKQGGFIGELTDDLKERQDAPRGSLLASRILWTFSSAYRSGGDPAHLEMASYAYRTLIERFWDKEQGGFLWRISADGAPLDARKQIYGHSFAIYALAEYSMASGSKEALLKAIETYRLVELHSRDRDHGGYLEAFTRDWKRPEGAKLSDIGPEEPKSQNTHLHLMEAYTTLLRAWPDEGLRADLSQIVELMLTRIPGPDGRHLGLYFTREWKPRSDRISYGHDIEANWLLTDAAAAIGDPVLGERVRKASLRLAEATLLEGMDSDGGIMNEGDPRGLTDTNKEWWPQAEALVGFMNAYQLSGERRYLEAALKVWAFTQSRIIDRKNGEWLSAVDRQGKLKPGHPKISFWKCPYHNGRACMELLRRIKEILGKNGLDKGPRGS